MRSLISIPVLGVALLFQSAIISRINLLSGCADLLLLVLAAWCLQGNARHTWVWALVAGLMVGYMSHLPLFVPLAGYLLVMLLGRLLQRRIWQAPLVGMFVIVLVGTLLTQASAYATLWLQGTPISLAEAFLQVVLPSMLLNLLLSAPVHYVMRDLARWLYPMELEE